MLLVWFSKNPAEALGIVGDKVCIRVLRISEGATAGGERAEKVLDSMIGLFVVAVAAGIGLSSAGGDAGSCGVM